MASRNFRADKADNIAAMDVRVRRWVTYPCVALNIAPNLGHYDGICVRGHDVTSLAALGITAYSQERDLVLRAEFEFVFDCSRAIMDRHQ